MQAPTLAAVAGQPHGALTPPASIIFVLALRPHSSAVLKVMQAQSFCGRALSLPLLLCRLDFNWKKSASLY